MAYSEDYIAEALAAVDANGGNVNGTAKQLGIAESTLRKWKTRASKITDRREAIARKGEVKKASLADRLEEIAWALAADLDDRLKRNKASLANTATAFGIVVDKMRLLRGEPTIVTEQRSEEYRDRLREHLNRIRSSPAARDRN